MLIDDNKTFDFVFYTENKQFLHSKGVYITRPLTGGWGNSTSSHSHDLQTLYFYLSRNWHL